MSKRRKEKDEEEEKPFKLPKFDEEAFLKKERRNIKTTFISFLFGILMALICFGFWALIGKNGFRWELVLLLAVINAAFLKYIFLKFNVELTGFTKMNWFSSFLIYFVTWLIVFIIIVNPPFYDDEAPMVDVAVLPNMQELGGTVKIVAKITDNIPIEKSNIEFDLTYPDGSKTSPDFTFKDNIFNFTFESPSNLTSDQETYNFKLTATDSSDHKTEREGSFSYSNSTIYLALPNNGDLVYTASDIKFNVGANVNRVYYTVDDTEINATKSGDYYVTNPGYIGWPKEKNVTVNINVSAYVVYYFENVLEDFNNTIHDTDMYTFITNDDKGGTKEPEKVTLPSAHYVVAPGFEIIVFLVSIVIAILIFKYRKKNESNKK